MKKWLKILLFCLTALTLISWDQATKALAKEHLKDHPPLSYFHNTFRREYVENTGAALSLGDDLPKKVSFWLLSVVPLMLLTAASFYVIKYCDQLKWMKIFSFAFIIAGGLGNIMDRILHDRHVTDFMNIGYHQFRTGIFNFADLCVSLGAILLLLSYRDHREQQLQQA